MGYYDTKQKIVNSLLGRPDGTQIQPDNHQDFALSLLEYIRSVELISGSTLIGIADVTTVPVQSDDANECYVSACPVGAVLTYGNFHGQDGNPITYSADQNSGALLLLLWNKQYWELVDFPTTIQVTAEIINYASSIRKTYASKEAMEADTNPFGDDGKAIVPGQLVTVVNSTDTTYNGIYARTQNGTWNFQSGFNWSLVQNIGDDANTAMSQKAVTHELNLIHAKIEAIKNSRYLFAGIATPTTNPGTPDGPVFYLASEGGTYTNFNAIELQDGLSVLMWNGSWSSQQIFSVDDEPTAGSDNLVKSGGVALNNNSILKNISNLVLYKDFVQNIGYKGDDGTIAISSMYRYVEMPVKQGDLISFVSSFPYTAPVMLLFNSNNELVQSYTDANGSQNTLTKYTFIANSDGTCFVNFYAASLVHGGHSSDDYYVANPKSCFNYVTNTYLYNDYVKGYVVNDGSVDANNTYVYHYSFNVKKGDIVEFLTSFATDIACVLLFDSEGTLLHSELVEVQLNYVRRIEIPQDCKCCINFYKDGINGAVSANYYIKHSVPYSTKILENYNNSIVGRTVLYPLYTQGAYKGEDGTMGYSPLYCYYRFKIYKGDKVSIATSFPVGAACLLIFENDTTLRQQLNATQAPALYEGSITSLYDGYCYVNFYASGATSGVPDVSNYYVKIESPVGNGLRDLSNQMQTLNQKVIADEKVIIVGDGQHYEEIQDAINAITDDTPDNHYTIIAMPKIYKAIHVGTFQTGTNICRNISIIGIDKYNTICLDKSGSYYMANEIRTNGVIKNITFIGDHTNFADDTAYITSVIGGTTRLGYACHVDLGSQDVCFEDCIFRGRNTVAVGAGLHKDEHQRYIRCEFYDERSTEVAEQLNPEQGVLYLHSMVFSNVTNQNLLFENCKFYGKNDCKSIVEIQCANQTGASGDIVMLFNTILKNGAVVQKLFAWTKGNGITQSLQDWNNEVSRGNNAEDMNYSLLTD